MELASIIISYDLDNRTFKLSHKGFCTNCDLIEKFFDDYYNDFVSFIKNKLEVKNNESNSIR